MESVLQSYIGVAVMALLALGLAAGMVAVSMMFGRRGRHTHPKDTPYECGVAGAGPVPGRVSVRFYVVCALFLVADVLVVYVYPMALVFAEGCRLHGLKVPVYLAGFVFLVLLGYLYARHAGAFRWHGRVVSRSGGTESASDCFRVGDVKRRL